MVECVGEGGCSSHRCYNNIHRSAIILNQPDEIDFAPSKSSVRLGCYVAGPATAYPTRPAVSEIL